MFTDFEKCIHLHPTKIKNIAISVLVVTILSHLYVMSTIILNFSNSKHIWEDMIKECQVLINIFVKFIYFSA